MVNNIYEQIYEVLDNYHKANDIHDDIKQYQNNLKAINNAMNYFNGITNYKNVTEVQQCLQDTDAKYAQYIRWCNCLQVGLSFKNCRTPIVQMTYECMVQRLNEFTQKIPAYVFLREQKDSLLNDFLKRFQGSDVTNEQIKEVKGRIQ